VRHGAAVEDGRFGCAWRMDLPFAPFSIDIGDFTGDGVDDIAVRDGGDIQVYAAAEFAPQ
jgi:hypothetical protein